MARYGTGSYSVCVIQKASSTGQRAEGVCKATCKVHHLWRIDLR